MQTLQNRQSGALDWVVRQAQRYGLLAQWPQAADVERLVGMHLPERLKRFGSLMKDQAELTGEGDGLIAVVVVGKASPWQHRSIESPGMGAVRESLGISANLPAVLDARYLPKPHELFGALAETVSGGERFEVVDFSVRTAARGA
ncbi:hypothetical protein [Gloeobacter morelensis]|uniref:hypothetical protein n=1 Tax=Gloeobacter morelensis TaxID=2907343 RepID=UPI001E3CF4DE|nr:hypothetical protein [Gloeobacter morelensis]UFP97262.1 hypothetical protein ISF26_24380 [Gloeobacter morelensis MG652769]